MAYGKSTIGPILANTLGWNFYDLDNLIEEAAGKSVRKIFEENGEDYFREFACKSSNASIIVSFSSPDVGSKTTPAEPA